MCVNGVCLLTLHDVVDNRGDVVVRGLRATGGTVVLNGSTVDQRVEQEAVLGRHCKVTSFVGLSLIKRHDR